MGNGQFDLINSLLAEGKYDEIPGALRGIKESKAKTSSELITLARAYSKCRNFDKAEKLYKKAYKLRASKLLFREIMDMCLECNRVDAAESYYERYLELAPGDAFNLFVYRYKIEKKIGRDPQRLIYLLNEAKREEYTEEYAYELAKQYHKAGMKDECMKECSEIIACFGGSKVVSKAKTLLSYYKGEITAEELLVEAEKQRVETTPTKELNLEKLREDDLADDSEEDDEGEDEWFGSRESKEKPVETTRVSQKTVTFEPVKTAEDLGNTKDFSEFIKDRNEDAEGYSAYEDTKDITKEFSEEETQEINDQITKEFSDEETQEIRSEITKEFSVPDTKEFTDDFLTKTSVAYDAMEQENQKPEKEPSPEALAARTSYELHRFDSNVPEDELKDAKVKKILEDRKIDLEKLCGNFYRIPSIRKEILKSLSLIVNERGRLFIVITGEKKSGRTTLATYMVRLLYRMGILKYDRLAKTDSEKLNKMKTPIRKMSIDECSLLIENAGSLDEKHLAEIMELPKNRKTGTCTILEDSARNLNRIFRAKEEFNIQLNNRIHLPKYSDDDIKGFIADILDAADYSISESAFLLLEEKLNDRRPFDMGSLEKVVSETKKIIASADRRYAPILLKMAANGEFDGSENLVILDEDVTP